MPYIGTQPNDVKKNTGLYTPSEILQLTKDGSWGGSLELIEEKSISSVSSAIFTDIKETKYDVHYLTVNNFQVSTDNVDLKIRYFENGVEESGAVYQYVIQYGSSGAVSFGESRSTGANHFFGTAATGNATNEIGNSYNYFYNLGNSSKYSFHTIQSANIRSDNSLIMTFGGSVLPQASLVNQIKLFVSAGTFSATAKLYGVKQI